MIDVAIIGAGTAGLTAAVYARRAGASVTIFEGEAPGGQIINDVVALVFNQKFYVIYNANNITYGELDTIFKMRKFTYKTYGV